MAFHAFVAFRGRDDFAARDRFAASGGGFSKGRAFAHNQGRVLRGPSDIEQAGTRVFDSRGRGLAFRAKGKSIQNEIGDKSGPGGSIF